MAKKVLFQYAVLWHPTDKQEKEESMVSKVLVEPTTVLSQDDATVKMTAAMNIPAEYKDQLDQIQIAVRPF